MTPREVVRRWLDREETKSVLAVTDLSFDEAKQLLRERDPLLTVEAPSGSFDEVCRGFRPFMETLIDRLTRIEHLTVDDELQSLLDHGLYNPHLGLIFERLWSARFAYGEGGGLEPALTLLLKTTFEEEGPALQSDALLFWLALFGQNYAVLPGMLNLVTREPVDKDLRLFLMMADVWQAKGSPLRVLVLS